MAAIYPYPLPATHRTFDYATVNFFEGFAMADTSIAQLKLPLSLE